MVRVPGGVAPPGDPPHDVGDGPVEQERQLGGGQVRLEPADLVDRAPGRSSTPAPARPTPGTASTTGAASAAPLPGRSALISTFTSRSPQAARASASSQTVGRQLLGEELVDLTAVGERRVVVDRQTRRRRWPGRRAPPRRRRTRTAASKAATVFSGAWALAPRWATTSGGRSPRALVHGKFREDELLLAGVSIPRYACPGPQPHLPMLGGVACEDTSQAVTTAKHPRSVHVALALSAESYDVSKTPTGGS